MEKELLEIWKHDGEILARQLATWNENNKLPEQSSVMALVSILRKQFSEQVFVAAAWDWDKYRYKVNYHDYPGQEVGDFFALMYHSYMMIELKAAANTVQTLRPGQAVANRLCELHGGDWIYRKFFLRHAEPYPKDPYYSGLTGFWENLDAILKANKELFLGILTEDPFAKKN